MIRLVRRVVGTRILWQPKRESPLCGGCVVALPTTLSATLVYNRLAALPYTTRWGSEVAVDYGGFGAGVWEPGVSPQRGD